MRNNNDIPIHKDNNGRIIDEDMSCIEKILHSKKLNYNDLTEISNPYFKDNKNETINIFIDLFDIFKQMYSPNLQQEIKTLRTDSKLSIIAELINIVAHYRHYFVSRYDKFCSIIFYYSSEKDILLTSIDKNYKFSFYNKRLISYNNNEYYVLNKILKDCIGLVKEYLKYIPHAYLIDTKKVEPQSLFLNLVNNISSNDINNSINVINDFNIIMSNNELSLLNLVNNDNVIIFKNNGRNKSYYISRNDIWNNLKLDNNIGIDEESLYLLFAISGNKHFDIKNLSKIGIKKAFSILVKKQQNGINLSELVNNYEKIKEVFNDLDYELIIKNLKLINYNNYPLTLNNKTNIIEQFLDISDFEYIKQETFKTFDAKHNVLLGYLFDGELIE